MNKILVTGFFGVNNLGDDIMLDSFMENIHDKSSVSLLQLYKGGKVETEISVKNLSMIPYGKSKIIDVFHSRLFDGLFWIGGTCMTDSAGDGAVRYMESFKAKGKKAGYIGIGINEIHNQERKKAYKRILDCADIVTLRDEKSYNIAREFSNNPKIFLTEDLVYLSESIIAPKLEKTKSRLLIAWRSLKGYYSEKTENYAIDQLVETLIRHKSDYDEIVVSSLGNNVDIDINKRIYEKLYSVFSNVEYINENDYRKRIDMILSATTVITGRLHGVFIAEWNNINTVAIGYDTKVMSFLKSVGREADLLLPENMDFDSIERALSSKKYPELTLSDWNLHKEKSLCNISLFEETIK